MTEKRQNSLTTLKMFQAMSVIIEAFFLSAECFKRFQFIEDFVDYMSGLSISYKFRSRFF